MKQNLRLGDSYTLLATNDTKHKHKHKRKRTAHAPLVLRSSSVRSPLRLDTRCATAPHLTGTCSAISPLLLRSFSACSPLLLRCFSAAPPLRKRRRNGKHTDNKQKTDGSDAHQVRSGYCSDNDLQRNINRAEAANPNGQSPWGEARLALPQIPPSLTLPSGPIRISSAYIPVKVPTSGILAKDRRLYSGIEAYTEGQGMGWGRLRKDLLCVQTLAQALALPGRGRAIGVLVVFLLAVSMGLQARQQPRPPFPTDSIKPLQIGDTIPEALWHLPLQVVNHLAEKETITLGDYKGKLIILDFWGTFCASCISAMPAIHEVQEQFADDMVVIPVSWSKPGVTEQALRNHGTLKPLGLSSIVEAKPLIDAFPHSVVPHYAWINPEGEVVATTAANDVSAENVAQVLRGEEPDYALKTYINTEKPLLFAMDKLPKGAEMQQYAVFIKGEIPSLGSSATLRIAADGDVHGMAIINKHLLGAYTIIAQKMKDGLPGKRLVMVDPIDTRSRYTIDFILPAGRKDSLYSSMLDYLNQQSGYTAQWVKRNRQCLALIRTGKKDRFIGKDGESSYNSDSLVVQVSNFPIGQFVTRLNWKDISGDILVLNETGYDGTVSITLQAPFDDRESIRTQLRWQGLDLIAAERQIEVFEIRRSADNTLFTKN